MPTTTDLWIALCCLCPHHANRGDFARNRIRNITRDQSLSFSSESMETLIIICTGQAKGRYQVKIDIDLGIWGDLLEEFMGEADVVSDFVYFASIVNEKDVNTVAKVFLFIFCCFGAFFQIVALMGGFVLHSQIAEEDPGRPSEVAERVGEYKKAVSHIKFSQCLVEDFPCLVIVLIIETKRKTFSGFALWSFILGTCCIVYTLTKISIEDGQSMTDVEKSEISEMKDLFFRRLFPCYFLIPLVILFALAVDGKL